MRLLCFGSAIRSKYRWKNLLLASQSISADIQGRMTKAGETGSVTFEFARHNWPTLIV